MASREEVHCSANTPHWSNNSEHILKGSIMELSPPSCLAAQHTNPAQGTLLVTVKHPDLIPSWSRCWPGKAQSWSTDTIQTPVSLIHILMLQNWGQRSKTILSEVRNKTISMVRWLILTRMNDHSWANLGGDFAINVPYGAVFTCYQAWKDFSTIIGWKMVLNYEAMLALLSSHTAYNPCTRYPIYHSQTAHLIPSWSRR